MDLFTALIIILAVAILASAWQRGKILDAHRFRQAATFFVAAVIVHNPVTEVVGWLPGVGIFLAVVARVVAYVVLVMSFYAVCRAWGAPIDPPVDPQQPPRSL